MKPIVVVSGLPRSGTSMMMAMIEAGGIELVTDGERRADEDNPKGYFELERVKALDRDAAWLADCPGKAIKVISRLLSSLPPDYTYKVVFMRRDMNEILASQRKMLERRNETSEVGDDEMRAMFFEHLDDVMVWLDAQENFSVKYASYNRLLSEPDALVSSLAEFVGFDAEKARARIDQALYRNRGQST